MLYVCVRGVMDVVFSVCIVRSVWLCLVCILWQFSMLRST